jgi:hypothetical protein
MTYDRFGELLQRGDVVAYADIDEQGDPKLDVYILTSRIDTNTCMGVKMSGDAIGEEFYLERTTQLCAYMYEAFPQEEDEDEESDQLPTFN